MVEQAAILDEHRLPVYVAEVRTQAGFALGSIASTRAAVEEHRREPRRPVWVREAHRHVQSALTAAARVSRILWPVVGSLPPGGSSGTTGKASKVQVRAARAATVRGALGIDAAPTLRSRTVRDHLEHYDERLDAWAAEERPWLIDMVIATAADLAPHRAELPAAGMHRVLDPETMTYWFWNDQVELPDLENELRLVHDAADKWLDRDGLRFVGLEDG
jgi:hypothetical protein